MLLTKEKIEKKNEQQQQKKIINNENFYFIQLLLIEKWKLTQTFKYIKDWLRD